LLLRVTRVESAVDGFGRMPNDDLSALLFTT
jgi:hypothetical protein